MKRVLVVAEWINPNGGVTKTLLELLKHLDPANYDVTIYIMRPDHSDLTAVPQHIRVIASDFDMPYLGAQLVFQRVLRQRRILTASRYAAAFVRWKLGGSRANYARFFTSRHPEPSGQYDLVLAYAMLDAYSNQFVAERIIAPQKIMWCHTDTALYSKRALSGLESVFKKFDAINCVSKSAMESLIEHFPDLDGRLRVRHNLMDDEGILRLSTEQGPSAPIGVTVLTTIARISPEKGIDLLVETAIKLRDEGYKFLWWVVGPDFGPEFAAAVKARSRNAGLGELVRFVGAQANPYPFIAACDIYVQPSRIEGFCMATAEAKILIKPVVRTDTGGAREQFEHRVTGSVVDVTVDGLFLEIARLIDFPEARESYQDALRRQSKSESLTVASFLE